MRDLNLSRLITTRDEDGDEVKLTVPSYTCWIRHQLITSQANDDAKVVVDCEIACRTLPWVGHKLHVRHAAHLGIDT
jgi:hypothetical protein